MTDEELAEVEQLRAREAAARTDLHVALEEVRRLLPENAALLEEVERLRGNNGRLRRAAKVLLADLDAREAREKQIVAKIDAVLAVDEEGES